MKYDRSGIRKNGGTVRFYNVLFPIWFLIFIPLLWVIVIPANFIIDSAVLLLTLVVLKKKYAPELSLKEIYLGSIWIVWLFGFLADLAGALALLLCTYLMPDSGTFGEWWYHNITTPLSRNPFSGWGLIVMLLMIALSGVLIYLLNYYVALKKVLPDGILRRKTALSLAIFTAPYTFLLPSYWFWQ